MLERLSHFYSEDRLGQDQTRCAYHDARPVHSFQTEFVTQRRSGDLQLDLDGPGLPDVAYYSRGRRFPGIHHRSTPYRYVVLHDTLALTKFPVSKLTFDQIDISCIH